MLNQWTRDATLMALLLVAAASSANPADLSVRGHYEDVNSTSAPNASGATLRTRLRLETPEIRFAQMTLEFENVTTLTKKDFSNGVRNRGTSVIADPDITEINQAYLRFSGIPRSIVQLGRQIVKLDNERFVGDVGFRQNQQTFDGVSVLSKPAANWSVYYAHLRAVNTIFGRKASNGRQRMKTNLFNVQYQLNSNSSVSAYHYAIENETLANSDHDTSGIRFTGNLPYSFLKPGGTFEYARQSPQRGATTHYALAEIFATVSRFQLLLGQETLGATRGTSFQTPLATLHKFQGFTDQFLTTPASGIKDQYVTFRVNAGPGRIEFTAHEFESDSGSDTGAMNLGKELSIGAWYRLGEKGSLLLKWARFDGAQQSGDIRKYWLQLGYDL